MKQANEAMLIIIYAKTVSKPNFSCRFHASFANFYVMALFPVIDNYPNVVELHDYWDKNRFA